MLPRDIFRHLSQLLLFSICLINPKSNCDSVSTIWKGYLVVQSYFYGTTLIPTATPMHLQWWSLYSEGVSFRWGVVDTLQLSLDIDWETHSSGTLGIGPGGITLSFVYGILYFSSFPFCFIYLILPFFFTMWTLYYLGVEEGKLCFTNIWK